MSHSQPVKFMPVVGIIAIGIFGASVAYAAETGVAAPNNLPNPFRAVEDWAKLPPGVEWGRVINVTPDAHGNIWVFHRTDPAIMEFDSSGKYIKGFGAGMFVE